MSQHNSYKEIASQYAEKNGILKYRVEGREMKYQQVFPIEGRAFNVSVNLDTMEEYRKEIRGIPLKHIMKPYKRNKR